MGLILSTVISEDVENYCILPESGGRIEITDKLFQNKSSGYLNKDTIPENVKISDFEFQGEFFKLAILYGEDSVKVEENKIDIGFDIFGAAFFMLSRMEECILDARDEHDRFEPSESLAVKESFYQLPVVDIYVRFLQRCIEFLAGNGVRKNFESILIPSHDLDHLQKLQNLRSLGGAVKRAISGKETIKHSTHYLSRFISGKNPYDQTANLIKLANKAGAKATFYFLVGSNYSKFDTGHFDKYRREANNFKNSIEKSGHLIGLHPSYLSMDNKEILETEKKKIEDWLGYPVKYSRQHYLRVSVPDTWRILNEAGIDFDSSMGFPDRPGFRCGTSRPFHVFDIEKKEKLNIQEMPLIAMDTSVLKDEGKSLEEKYDEIQFIKEQIRLNGGNWHFLIHNSNFFWLDEKDYFELWHSFYEF